MNTSSRSAVGTTVVAEAMSRYTSSTRTCAPARSGDSTDLVERTARSAATPVGLCGCVMAISFVRGVSAPA